MPRFAGKYALPNGDSAVLGRYDIETARPTRAHVDRKQCRVHVGEDGSATLVSHGEAPTGWRAPGAPWQWLVKDQAQALEDGDQISINYYEPESIVFTCSVDASGERRGVGVMGRKPRCWG